MVVFQCENCGQTIKKPKAEQHARSCRGFRGYVCIDCMKVFTGDSYKAHTSCISEAEKYQGALYDPTNGKKGKKGGNQQQKQQQQQQKPQQQQQQQQSKKEETLKRKHEDEEAKVEEKKVEETKVEEGAPSFKKPKVADELISGCKAQIEKIIAKNNGNKPDDAALHDMMLSLFEKAYKKANK